MTLNGKNVSVQELISNQKRRDGQIIPGVYISMTYRADGLLVWLYIGTQASGPMLQYQPDALDAYDGEKWVTRDIIHCRTGWSNGAWTPIYSRGDFGRNYSCGGHWSGHSRSLHPAVGDQTRRDKAAECLVLDGGAIVALPDGIKGDIAATSFDCSLQWAVWYQTAADALAARLTADEIAESKLPQITKDHLITHEQRSMELLRELAEIYKL